MGVINGIIPISLIPQLVQGAETHDNIAPKDAFGVSSNLISTWRRAL